MKGSLFRRLNCPQTGCQPMVFEALTTAGASGDLDTLIWVRPVNSGKRYFSRSIDPLPLLHVSDPGRSQDRAQS
jgi:hypothetical protein